MFNQVILYGRINKIEEVNQAITNIVLDVKRIFDRETKNDLIPVVFYEAFANLIRENITINDNVIFKGRIQVVDEKIQIIAERIIKIN